MENLPQQLLIRVLANWFDVSAMGTLEITEISGGLSGASHWKVTTPQGSFCLRRWPDQPRSTSGDLIRIHRLLEHTWQSGFHEIPLPQRTLQKSHVEAQGTIWELNTWLTGSSTLTPTLEQGKAAAEALARFHLAAASFQQQLHGCPPGLKHRLEILQDLRAGELGKLKSAVDRAPPSETRDVAQRTLAPIELALPKAIDVIEHSRRKVPIQWCHGDTHIGNFLFVDENMTGIVDFATAGQSSVAQDIARLMGSMVPHLDNPWRDCVEAYRQQRPLSADEIHLIFAFHVSGTIGAAANWLRWRFIDDFSEVNAANAQARLVDFAARLRLVGEAELALSPFFEPNA